MYSCDKREIQKETYTDRRELIEQFREMEIEQSRRQEEKKSDGREF